MKDEKCFNKKIGEQTVKFETPPVIISTAAVVGAKEGSGPLKDYFDIITEDASFGENTWEKAESKFVKEGLNLAIKKSDLNLPDIDYIIAGDLLNQSIGSTFGIKDLERPFFGVFAACSTIGEAMGLAAILVDGNFAKNVLVGASSHFCTAEKQFRFPLELGTQRPLSSTWTVTGQGSAIISKDGDGPVITYITTGKIVDLGITDANNMGAAMAPAAVNVLLSHFKDTNTTPDDFDLILTGDLGYVGKALVIDLMASEGYNLNRNYTDCGIEIFDQTTQDTHSGGSGCACSAATFCAYYYKKLKAGELKKVFFIPTGALMSTTSAQQGESIPAIAHGVIIEYRG